MSGQSNWLDNPYDATAMLTIDDLAYVFEKIRAAETYPHGSEQRPHIVHPKNPDFCIECGYRRES